MPLVMRKIKPCGWVPGASDQRDYLLAGNIFPNE